MRFLLSVKKVDNACPFFLQKLLNKAKANRRVQLKIYKVFIVILNLT